MKFLLNLKYLILFLILLFMLNQAWWINYKWPWLIFYFTFILSVIYVIIFRRNFVPTKDEIILLAFPAYIFLREIFAENTAFLVNLSYIFLCLSFLLFGKEIFKIENITKILILVLFIQSLIGLFEFIQGHTLYITWREERYVDFFNYNLLAIGSTAMDSNYLALNILPIIPLCIYLIKVSPKDHQNKIIYILIGFFLFIIFLTQSRAAFFSLLIFVILIIFKKKNAIKVTAFTIILALAYLYFTNKDLLENLNQLRSIDPSAWIRISIWQSLLQTFSENPIFGIGKGQYQEMSIQYLRLLRIRTETQYAPMNMFLGTLTELGIVGFVLLLTLIINNLYLLSQQIKSSFYNRSVFAKYFLISFIIWLIMSFSLDGTTTYLFWVLVTLPLINKKSYSELTPEHDMNRRLGYKLSL